VSHKIGVIPGDGIGHEVIPEALKVVRATGVELDTVDYDLGGARYLRDGEVLSDETVQEWRGLDALLLGAVGTPDVPPGVIERGLLLKMRFDLDLYINQRPFLAPDGSHDFIVIRENTEGTYAGEGGFLRKGTPHEIATQGSVNTRFGVERCVRYAFELAMTRRQHLTLVHKTNVLTFAGDLWARVFAEVIDVTGIVLTKLDGTAKGGIVFQVQKELGVPVKLVGLGEGPDDLAPFDPEAFVDALLADEG